MGLNWFLLFSYCFGWDWLWFLFACLVWVGLGRYVAAVSFRLH